VVVAMEWGLGSPYDRDTWNKPLYCYSLWKQTPTSCLFVVVFFGLELANDYAK